MIEIRRAAIESADAVRLMRALDAEMLARYPESGTEEHLRLAAEDVAPGRGVFLVAYRYDVAVACGAVTLIDPHTAEVRRMIVAPAVRGRGIGRTLLRALQVEALDLGARRLVLETGPRQPEAIALYSRFGFSEIEAFGRYAPHPLSLFMGKNIGPGSQLA